MQRKYITLKVGLWRTPSDVLYSPLHFLVILLRGRIFNHGVDHVLLIATKGHHNHLSVGCKYFGSPPVITLSLFFPETLTYGFTASAPKVIATLLMSQLSMTHDTMILPWLEMSIVHSNFSLVQPCLEATDLS